MLPILRVFPVGGVLLAIFILALALSPPDGTRSHLVPGNVAARGALIARTDHPEWRQFLMLAAIQRADALAALRDLPDSPPSTAPAPAPPAAPQPALAPAPAPPASQAATVPDEPVDNDPQEYTGSIPDDPAIAMPLDIGDTSSNELPISAPPEPPPVTKPESLKTSRASEIKTPAQASRKKRVRQVRRAIPPVKPNLSQSFNGFAPYYNDPNPPAEPRNVSIH